MEAMRVKPAKGRTVRFPDTGQALPEEGAAVPCSTYWTRRLRGGDVEVVETKPAKPTKRAPKES